MVHSSSVVAPLVLAVVATAPIVALPAASQSPKPTPEAYLRVVAPLAVHDRTAALAALTDFEQRVVDPERPTPTLERLLVIETKAARRIAGSRPAALPPMIDLHVRSHRFYRSRHELLLLRHSRNAVVALTGVLLEQGKSLPEARPVASWLLTDLGDSLLRIRGNQPAEQVFRRAVELDPANGRARLGLAVIYEKTARYAEAASVLADARPPQSLALETQLRLAINRRRIGEGGSARGQLAALLHTPEHSWITVLAYQELARGLLQTGEPGAAVGVLREGRDRFPEDQRIAIQLCYALERAGELAAARRAAASLAEPVVSPYWPRDRYNHYPELLLRAAERAPAEEWLDQGAEDLGAALAAVAPTDEPR